MTNEEMNNFIKGNTMLGDCLSQKMTLYELRTLLIKYENEQLRILSVGKSVKEKEEIDFKIWAKENAGVPPESFYFYKGQWQTVKELRLIYNTSIKNQP